MKKNYKIFTILVLIFGLFLQAPGFCNEILNLGVESNVVKLDTISDGLIVTLQNGVRKSYIRKEDSLNKYPDYIIYSGSAFAKKQESTSCRVVFLDTFVVKFKTPNENMVEIPRYRVKNLEINIR